MQRERERERPGQHVFELIFSGRRGEVADGSDPFLAMPSCSVSVVGPVHLLSLRDQHCICGTVLWKG